MKAKYLLATVLLLICLSSSLEATAQIKIVKGNDQGALVGTTLFPFHVKVIQPNGDPLVGEPIKFTIVEGGGSLSDTEVTTNHEGEAQTTLTLPNVAGTVKVKVEVKNQPEDGPIYASVEFTATAFAPPPSPSFTAGESITFSVEENRPKRTTVGTLKVQGLVEGVTYIYSFNEGYPDRRSFNFAPAVPNGVRLITTAVFDFETKNTYTFQFSLNEWKDGVWETVDSITVNVNVLDVYAFTQDSTTRSVKENVPIGTNVGAPIVADELGTRNHRYELGATADIVSFSIDNNTGQLKTKEVFDYETKNTYTVKVDLYLWYHAGWIKQDTITVTIKVIDAVENSAPVFTEGDSTTRSVVETTPSNSYIGIPVRAKDADGDTLTYTLSGPDAASFDIDSSRGQLKTKAPLDYETKNQYTVTITVSDGSLTDTITVTINVTKIEPGRERAPVFNEGDNTTRSIAENTPPGVNIGAPVLATDPDGDTVTYSLDGTDAASFSIDSSTGQLKTKAPLDYETKNQYTFSVIAHDGLLRGIIIVTLNVTDDVSEPSINRPPVFTDGDNTTRSIVEHLPPNRNIGKPVSATDTDDDRLTYSLSGSDAAAFSIDSSTGQLKTKALLDYETKNQYIVVVTVSDGKGGSDSITVIINVVDLSVNNPPVFTEGDSTTRSIAEDAPSGTNIGAPVSATDIEGDTLTYSFSGFRSRFRIDSDTGQLRTFLPLDYEKRNQYILTVTATDENGGRASITVTINVTDVYEPPTPPPSTNYRPTFSEGDDTTRIIKENTPPGVNITPIIRATDADGDTLTYTLGGPDAAAFAIDSTTGELKTKAPLDYETKNQYTVVITVSDGRGGSDSITVIIKVRDVYDPPNNPPSFTEGDTAIRSVAEETSRNKFIGKRVSATDPDADYLTYSLSGPDAASFSILSLTGQLITKAWLDYETKKQYTVVVTVSDGRGGSDAITVTINVTNVTELTSTENWPTFAEGESTIRSVAENTPSRQNIGAALRIALPEKPVEYNFFLTGPDAQAFRVSAFPENGGAQLKTRAPLDYETKNQYTVKVLLAVEGQVKDIITVTINVTDVYDPPNTAPVFTEGGRATRSIAENTPPNRNIGIPVRATDADDDTLTYSLGGSGAASFDIDNSTGQLITKASLDYETKTSYTVVVTVSDGDGGSDTITITINITDIYEPPPNTAPAFTEGGSTTRSIAENTPPNRNIGIPVRATDADDDTLTYGLGGSGAASFDIDSSTGQLITKASLDYETKTSYIVVVIVSDGNGGSDAIAVTINVTPVIPPVQLPAIDRVIFNELFNGSNDTHDWLELRNISSTYVDLTGWTLTIITGLESTDVAFLTGTTLPAGEVLLFVNTDPDAPDMPLASSAHYIVDAAFTLPQEDFMLILRSPEVYEDSAGNYFFGYDAPPIAPPLTAEQAWYRAEADMLGYQAEAWTPSGYRDGLGYDDGTPEAISLGTPGYLHKIPGDLNDDGTVNIQDLVLVAAEFGESGDTDADVNGDGEVNIQDIVWISNRIGDEAAAPAANGLTASQVQQWLRLAKRSAPLSIERLISQEKLAYDRGIQVLEKILRTLIPKTTALLANYPNPFNPETWIPYQLAKDANVQITIYDMRGTVVRQLDIGHRSAGAYTSRGRAVHWNGTNEAGEKVSSGFYFYHLQADSVSLLRKMVILK